jgi:hypothetical protein
MALGARVDALPAAIRRWLGRQRQRTVTYWRW